VSLGMAWLGRACRGSRHRSAPRKQAHSVHAGYQAAETAFGAAIQLYNSQLPSGGEPINYKALTAEFEGFGIAGLNNGLDAAENERLFNTMNLPEMIALVLRGLSRLGKPQVLAS